MKCGADGQTDLWHKIELKSHGDDVESDDAGDGQVKVLTHSDAVEKHSWLGVERPIRHFVAP